MFGRKRYNYISALLLMLAITVCAYSAPDVQLGVGEEHTFRLGTGTAIGERHYSWFVDGIDQEVDADSITLSWDDVGLYRLSASYSVNGCMSEPAIIEIEVTGEVSCPDIDPAKFFTPDGDGVNEFWWIKNIECYPDAKIEIFDRYSRRLAFFTGEEFINLKGWDGYYNGHPMPSDDYWYYIRDVIPYKPRSGHFILKRGNK
ncbi:MAG: T9SS type B sorting domain-containing protein [Paludibacteraceae bacterium]|nr:T9SS type B sorting domain-containing protein [Paludibacteraceae bacterium]